MRQNITRCTIGRVLPPPLVKRNNTLLKKKLTSHNFKRSLRADVSKYRPEVYKSEKSKILKKIHKVALGKLLT